MNRIILILVLLFAFIASVSAQEPLVEIIFGPRDGDSAGTLHTHENSLIAVDVWMRTAPGIGIISFPS